MTDFFDQQIVESKLEPGQTSAQHNITIVSDNMAEDDETFTLSVRDRTARVSVASGFDETNVTITEKIRKYPIMLVCMSHSRELR